MSEPIRIDELDWTDLEGKTMNATIQVLNGRAFLIEGQQVHMVDLTAGKVQEELPFFGPRSSRTGRLTEEQERALDVLIADGYTIHRAAMLLGISDSTVSHRRKQLKEGREVAAATSLPERTVTRAITGPQSKLTDTEISNIKYLFFIAGEQPMDIAQRLKRGHSTVQTYLRRMDDGMYEELPPLVPVGYAPVINHQPAPAEPEDPGPAPTPVVAVVAEPPEPTPEPEPGPVTPLGRAAAVSESEVATIFRLRAQGMTTEQIAVAVRRGETTVKRYLSDPTRNLSNAPEANGHLVTSGVVEE